VAPFTTPTVQLMYFYNSSTSVRDMQTSHTNGDYDACIIWKK